MEEIQQVQIAFMESGNINFVFTTSEEFFVETTAKPRNIKKYSVIKKEAFESLEKDYLLAYELDKELNLQLNLEKAKEIHKNIIRMERKPILEKLDVDFMLALEDDDNEKRKQVAEKKNYYRSLTGKADEAGSLEDLKKITTKDYSGLVCNSDDLRAAGFCAAGSKEWFEKNGWDFKDFIKNGKKSEDALESMMHTDPNARAILDAAYKRIRG